MQQTTTTTRDQLKHNLAAEVLQTAGSFRLAAFGYSMLPTLWPGDLLTIQAQSFDQVEAPDIVLFRRDGRFFIHRILHKIDGSPDRRLITRGDALPEADLPVSPEELLGKIVRVRYGGRDVPVPACSHPRRWLGLALTYSVPMRSLALRWRVWRTRDGSAKPELAADRISLG
jgi:hypothetical protein